MAVRFYAAVDGGASNTRVRLVDAAGHVLGDGAAGPSSLTLGVPSAWAEIRKALAAAGLTDAMAPEIVLACGLAGTGTPARRAEFLATAPRFADLRLVSDGHATVLGAHGGVPGATVAVGTGTVGNVLRPDGVTRQVSGWGFPAGDEGSGAWLGWRAIAETLHWVDDRDVDPPGGSALHRAVRARCGPGPAELLAWLLGAPSTKYAGLAPLVVDHAAEGDPAALRLLAAAGREIDRVVRALDPDGALPLCLGGGLAAAIRPHLDPAIAARLRTPQGDARDGALLLARGLAPGERPAAAA